MIRNSRRFDAQPGMRDRVTGGKGRAGVTSLLRTAATRAQSCDGGRKGVQPCAHLIWRWRSPWRSCAAPSVAAEPSIPPVASLADGVWMKGDLHVHSRHSKDSSNNSVAKIIALAEAVHMDYLCITDHDNHVNGDVAHNTWIDPEYASKSVVLLYRRRMDHRARPWQHLLRHALRPSTLLRRARPARRGDRPREEGARGSTFRPIIRGPATPSATPTTSPIPSRCGIRPSGPTTPSRCISGTAC